MTKLLILVLLTISLISCKNENKEIENKLSEIIEKKIELIDSLSYYSPEKGFFKNHQNATIKIVTYIDGGVAVVYII